MGRGGRPQNVAATLGSLRLMRGVPLLRVIWAAMFLMVVLMFVLDYVVSTVLTQHFRDERSLGHFFAVFTVVAHSLTLLGQTLLSSRLLERFGYRVVNLVYPVTTLLAFLALAVSPGLWSAVAGRLNYMSLLAIFRNPAANLAYMALPPYLRGRARATATGVMLPLGMAVAGLVLIFVPQQHVLGGLAWAGCGLAGLYLLVKLRQVRSYREALHQLIMQKVFAGEVGSLEQPGRLDGVIVRRLGEQLRGGCDDAQAVAIVDLLRRGEPRAASAELLAAAPGLGDPLRDRILRVLAELDAGDWKAYARECLYAGEAHLRATAFSLLVRARQKVERPLIESWLHSASPRLAATAAAAALHSGEPDRSGTGRKVLHVLLRSEDEGSVICGVSIVAQAGDAGWSNELLALLGHASPRVRAEAVAALCRLCEGRQGHGPAWLCDAWRDPAPPVRAAVLRHGFSLMQDDERWRVIADALHDPEIEVRRLAGDSVRLHLPEDAKALSRLLAAAGTHFELHHEACRAISARSFQGKAGVLAGLETHHLEAAQSKGDLARWLDAAPAANRLASPSARTFLAMVLREEASRHGEAAVDAAEAATGSQAAGAVRAAMAAEDRQLRALALESLHQRRLSAQERLLLEFLEGEMSGAVAGGAARRWENILPDTAALGQWCAQRGSPWLQECAAALLSPLTPAGGGAR